MRARNVVIVESSRPMPGVIELVESATFGSDGLKYQRLNVQAQLDRFNAPVYFHALADDQLCGVYVLDKRTLLVSGQTLPAFYRGMLAVANLSQGKGVGKQLTQYVSDWLSNQSQTSPLLSYGCIDQSNSRSLHVLHSTGAESGAALSMYMMYRQWPAKRFKLQPIEVGHEAELTDLNNKSYADCHLRDITPSKLPGFVLKNDKGVAVSAKVTATSFKIVQMSTLAQWSTRLFVRPFAPAIKRFNPDCFRYVSFSDVVIRSGCEPLWHDFVSSILAEHSCYFGAVFVDPRSQLFKQLQRANPATRFVHSEQGSINVVTKVYNDYNKLSNQLLQNKSPVHLWPVDA